MVSKSWTQTPWKLFVVGLVLDLPSGLILGTQPGPLVSMALALVGTLGFIMMLMAVGLWIVKGLKRLTRG